MAEYVAIVMETVTNVVRYVVEAETREEAEEKAGIGDTVREEHLRTFGVLDRTVEHVEPAASIDVVEAEVRTVLRGAD